ncbi:MAG: hypothetical protein JSV31_10490, partial [Desulfobacterales bacterium]
EAKYQSRQFGQMGKLQNQASKALGYKDHLKKIREQGKSYQQYTEANYENKKILIDLYAKKAELSHRQSLKCTLIIECYNSKLSNDELTKCTEKANLY